MRNGVEPPHPAIPLPVEELDRKLRWRFVPIVVFVATLIALTVVAAGSLAPPRATSGLPDDRDVRAAHELLQGRVSFDPAPYLYRSEFLGLAGEAQQPATPADPATIARADSLLRVALARRPLDARVLTALGSLELVRGRLRRAEGGFRRASELAGHCPDARIGLAVTLALRADRSGDPFEQRRLRLRAIAQLFDVRRGHPGESVALYDRALLSELVGRKSEARRAAAELVALEPTNPLAQAMNRKVAGLRP